MQQAHPDRPPSQGLRLYWRSLEALVAAEHARAGDASPGAAAALLGAPLFHRCVAGCAFEVVVGAYRMVRAGGLGALGRRTLGHAPVARAVNSPAIVMWSSVCAGGLPGGG